MEKWIANAICNDGTEIEKDFPYTAKGNYLLENEEQYNIECRLFEMIEKANKTCVWYSVCYVNENK